MFSVPEWRREGDGRSVGRESPCQVGATPSSPGSARSATPTLTLPFTVAAAAVPPKVSRTWSAGSTRLRICRRLSTDQRRLCITHLHPLRPCSQTTPLHRRRLRATGGCGGSVGNAGKSTAARRRWGWLRRGASRWLASRMMTTRSSRPPPWRLVTDHPRFAHSRHHWPAGT